MSTTKSKPAPSTPAVTTRPLPRRIDPAHIDIHEVHRGPNWLFVRLTNEQAAEPQELIEELRDICAKHFIYRLVLELDQLEGISDRLGRRLAELDQRLASRGGALRLCCLNAACEQQLRECRLSRPLHNHQNRHDAVLAVVRQPESATDSKLLH